MPKSTPKPTNSTKKAIEIRLKAPTMMMPIATVTARPTARLKNTAAMIFQERNAIQRMIRMPSVAVNVSRTALYLMTENWSSCIST